MEVVVIPVSPALSVSCINRDGFIIGASIDSLDLLDTSNFGNRIIIPEFCMENIDSSSLNCSNLLLYLCFPANSILEGLRKEIFQTIEPDSLLEKLGTDSLFASNEISQPIIDMVKGGYHYYIRALYRYENEKYCFGPIIKVTVPATFGKDYDLWVDGFVRKAQKLPVVGGVGKADSLVVQNYPNSEVANTFRINQIKSVAYNSTDSHIFDQAILELTLLLEEPSMTHFNRIWIKFWLENLKAELRALKN
jgi:hypothetical protein